MAAVAGPTDDRATGTGMLANTPSEGAAMRTDARSAVKRAAHPIKNAS